VIIISMLSAYKASISFLQEHRSALGEGHRSVGPTTKSELLHLSKLFRHETLDSDAREGITSLIGHIKADKSGIFSEADRTQLIEVSASRLSASMDEVPAGGHGSQKSQSHLYSHRYLDSADWDYIQDETYTIKSKMTYLSKRWLSWGLRFPSGPTFRSGLALLAVASKLATIDDPTKMHELVLMFQKEFRKLRELYPGAATQKEFPPSPADYKTVQPTLLGDFVECRVDVAKVTELSHPSAIPLKLSNSSLTSPCNSSTSASLPSSSKAKPTDDFIRTLLSIAMGGQPPATEARPAVRHRVKKQDASAKQEASAAGVASPAPLEAPAAPAPGALAAPETPAEPAAPAALAALVDQDESQAPELSAETLSLLGNVPQDGQRVAIDRIAQDSAAFILARKNKRAAEAAAETDAPKRRIVGKTPWGPPKSNKSKAMKSMKKKVAMKKVEPIQTHAATTLQLGCKTCRGAVAGCPTCRRPSFAGWRGTVDEWKKLGLK
jgi:hypothetical protein